MADNKNYFEFLDIPNGSGSTERWYVKDDEARDVLDKAELLHPVKSPTGTAGNTASGSYNRTQWAGTVDGVTALYDNLVVLYKIPVAGVSRGVTLNINSLGEHPVVLGANATVSTLYPVGSVIPLVYDSTQKASVYVSNTNTEYTGCWKIGDANTTYSAGTLAQLNDGTNTTNRVWQAKIIADYVKEYAVTGPSSSIDAHVATFNGTGGKTIKDSGFTIGKSVPSNAVFTDTTYESKAASSGGTAVSLCTTGEKYEWNKKGSYSKPSGGIPKTDLASAVQTSLDKADSALQQHQTVTLATGTNNGTMKITVGSNTTDNVPVKGLSSAAYKDVTSSIDGTNNLPTASAVQSYVGTIVSYPLEASIGGVITDITVIL